MPGVTFDTKTAVATVHDVITFSNACVIVSQGRELIKYNKKISFDFSGLNEFSSVVLAIVLDWIKTAKLHESQITFANLPDKMKKLFQLCYIYDIIPVV